METRGKIPDKWRPAARMITTCARCGDETLKRNAVAIYKKKTNENMALLFHFCRPCYYSFLDDYGIGE